MDNDPIITTLVGALPGPTVAVFAAVHGDEPVGVKALEQLLPSLELVRGTVLAVIANPVALKAGKRFVDLNLNRSLSRGASGDTVEGKLAFVLMEMLDGVDALLDIHAGMGGEPPFVICEENSFGIASRMPVSIVSTGWVEAEPGSTDEYMFRSGKPAVCVECGDKADWEKMTPLAVEMIKQFLSFFQMIEGVEPAGYEQRIVKVRYPVFKESTGFAFFRKFRGFEALFPGELIAVDGGKAYRAPEYPSCIIFPWADAPVGTEVFLIAENNRS